MTAQAAWPENASIEQRLATAVALARHVDGNHPLDLRCEIEATLTLAALDPAPRVRLALAEAISTSPNAPVQVIAQLATDRPDIAGIVLARSPVVTQGDLIELATRLDPRVLPVLAGRAEAPELAELLIELGDASCSAVLVRNPAVGLTSKMLEQIARRHGHDVSVRERLLERADLPVAARYALVDRLCSVLSTSGLVSSILGQRRAHAIMTDAQGGALLSAAHGRSAEDLELLVEEVEALGGLDCTMLLRAVAHGENELFAALLARLAGIGLKRTRSILRTSRRGALKGLLERCDMTPEVAGMITECALALFRAPAGSGPAQLTAIASEVCKPVCQQTGTLVVSLRRWHVEALRHGGLRYARQIAQAA